jgi:hypothetical protein
MRAVWIAVNVAVSCAGLVIVLICWRLVVLFRRHLAQVQRQSDALLRTVGEQLAAAGAARPARERRERDR